MTKMRKYLALAMLLAFSCYYSGISLFSHVHIVNGVSVVHSHLAGNSEHNHSESQYAVIDILSNFQSEYAVDYFTVESPFFLLLTESVIGYQAPSNLNEELLQNTLRGPPHC